MRFASLENLDEAEGVDEINSYVDLNSKENVSPNKSSRILQSLTPTLPINLRTTQDLKREHQSLKNLGTKCLTSLKQIKFYKALII